MARTSDRPSRMFYGNVLFKRFLDFLPAFDPQMTSKKSFHLLSQIFQHVESIGALDGLRGTGDGGGGIFSSPVSAYHLAFWMRSHPGRSQLCVAERRGDQGRHEWLSRQEECRTSFHAEYSSRLFPTSRPGMRMVRKEPSCGEARWWGNYESRCDRRVGFPIPRW
jgi:hypothetical protein